MAYSAKSGRKPRELASKVAHTHIVNDPDVLAFLDKCSFPKRGDAVSIRDDRLHEISVSDDPIRIVIAVDGGYTEVSVRDDYPSAAVCFFQFGALIFRMDDLESLEESPFIDPEDMAKLKQIDRFKLTVPIRNICLKGSKTLTDSLRKALHDFLIADAEDSLAATLKWLIFREYLKQPAATWELASCPVCSERAVQLDRKSMQSDYSWACTTCGGDIYVGDVMRLHEAIDNEVGAGGIVGYLGTATEQIILAHVVRMLLAEKPSLLKSTLFIKDGPLGFFGQTANLHVPMRELVRYLHEQHAAYLVGVEKSGAFVEHADQIADKIPRGSFLLLDNDYIYQNILPGAAGPDNVYGQTTYYGTKVILRSPAGGMYVATVPTAEAKASPSVDDAMNVHVVLNAVGKLRCDMYDSALLPVALVNKLVSLSNHPSAKILAWVAKERIT